MTIDSYPLNKIAITLVGMTAVLMIINVWMSARVAQDGLAIDSLIKRETALKNEIRDLNQQVVMKTSLHDLSREAQILGYSAPANTVTITTIAPIAFKRQ